MFVESIVRFDRGRTMARPPPVITDRGNTRCTGPRGLVTTPEGGYKDVARKLSTCRWCWPTVS